MCLNLFLLLNYFNSNNNYSNNSYNNISNSIENNVYVDSSVCEKSV